MQKKFANRNVPLNDPINQPPSGNWIPVVILMMMVVDYWLNVKVVDFCK